MINRGQDVKVLHPDPEVLRIADLLAEVMGPCPTCGDRRALPGLTVKCQDWHEVCSCGERYDRPKAKGCRRRKHPKEEK